ncbi:septal ring lytic transglycosylase RlpA family protein [Candidatus Magnetominusculus xianensis]|uniref:RlpA-like protein n=1 Tax=Candidatus Magnetominusculus xianensis TaxID=1748249 RepID=A0ABR5SID6_9BACT|nr:septal ring lytic transglycosylase RlpA family protein [Candidatus Magnetominusculus xianensis]KWT91018.1 RlpA-like protein precursor [Candidatus Magnetominusculus xianensis]MBF0402589.1 hypothetical protein [Nitrospirota bacterium]
MKGDCYLKDPETGKFMGSKPGCSYGGGEVSDELSQRVEREKGVIKQRVDAVAALGNLKPQDSELKDKAERLAREVNRGDLSFQEGLYQLSKGNAPFNRYAKAVELLDRDPKYWRDIAKKGGSDEVDTLLGSFVGVPVTGVADYALNVSKAKSGVQQIIDKKSQKSPPHLDSNKVYKTEKEWLDNIRNNATNFKKLNKEGRFNNTDKFTQCSGDTCKTQASVYGNKWHNKQTANGEIFDKNKFTAAMQRFYTGGSYKDVYAEVTNTANGKTVIVKINDSGPYVTAKVAGQLVPMPDPTRGIDLSPAAYGEIADKMGAGLLNVKVTFLSAEDGQRKYKEQNEAAEKRRPGIEQKAHDALCANDEEFRNDKNNNCR